MQVDRSLEPFQQKEVSYESDRDWRSARHWKSHCPNFGQCWCDGWLFGSKCAKSARDSGLDPTLGGRSGSLGTEQWQGIDFGNYPNARIIMFGLNVGF